MWVVTGRWRLSPTVTSQRCRLLELGVYTVPFPCYGHRPLSLLPHLCLSLSIISLHGDLKFSFKLALVKGSSWPSLIHPLALLFPSLPFPHKTDWPYNYYFFLFIKYFLLTFYRKYIHEFTQPNIYTYMYTCMNW